jgi:hypothetical protein
MCQERGGAERTLLRLCWAGVPTSSAASEQRAVKVGRGRATATRSLQDAVSSEQRLTVIIMVPSPATVSVTSSLHRRLCSPPRHCLVPSAAMASRAHIGASCYHQIRSRRLPTGSPTGVSAVNTARCSAESSSRIEGTRTRTSNISFRACLPSLSSASARSDARWPRASPARPTSARCLEPLPANAPSRRTACAPPGRCGTWSRHRLLSRLGRRRALLDGADGLLLGLAKGPRSWTHTSGRPAPRDGSRRDSPSMASDFSCAGEWWRDRSR